MAMENLSDQQISFLTKFLGIKLADSPFELTGEDDWMEPEGYEPVVPIWQQAKDALDAQLGKLADTLRISGDPELEEITDEVTDLLKPVRVGLAGPLIDLDMTPRLKGARDGAISAIANARSWIDSDPRIEAIDNNPWGINVSVASTLGDALDRIEARIVSVQGAKA